MAVAGGSAGGAQTAGWALLSLRQEQVTVWKLQMAGQTPQSTQRRQTAAWKLETAGAAPQHKQTATWKPQSAGWKPQMAEVALMIPQGKQTALLIPQWEQTQGQQVQRTLVEVKQAEAAQGTKLAQDARAGAAQCRQPVHAATVK